MLEEHLTMLHDAAIFSVMNIVKNNYMHILNFGGDESIFDCMLLSCTYKRLLNLIIFPSVGSPGTLIPMHIFRFVPVSK